MATQTSLSPLGPQLPDDPKVLWEPWFQDPKVPLVPQIQGLSLHNIGIVPDSRPWSLHTRDN